MAAFFERQQCKDILQDQSGSALEKNLWGTLMASNLCRHDQNKTTTATKIDCWSEKFEK